MHQYNNQTVGAHRNKQSTYLSGPTLKDEEKRRSKSASFSSSTATEEDDATTRLMEATDMALAGDDESNVTINPWGHGNRNNLPVWHGA